MPMKLHTTDDVQDLLDGYITSAALGAAMELGLFWLLAERPQGPAEVGRALGIPGNRCRYWLQLLEDVGLVEETAGGYRPTPAARTAILDAYSRESWAFLAGEARQRFPAVSHLAAHMRAPESVWALQGLTPPNYLKRLQEDPGEARRFTRMLYEIHRPLADEIAAALDMAGVARLLDLGGGSGVASFALLRRHPSLSTVVVDIPNVCRAGRELAHENGLEGRIEYHGADFLRDPLPTGFDVVLNCDAGAYSDEMFHKVGEALNAGGRLVIVNHFAPAPGVAPPSYRYWAFLGALSNPASSLPTVAEVQAQLQAAGFRVSPARELHPSEVGRWSGDWTMLEARK
jgi:SAM-dependent methyltransferase